MSVSVHYVDNVRNVKTNRGGITGHIYCLSHFLACKITIHTDTFILLCNFINFILYVYFMPITKILLEQDNEIDISKF